MHIMSQLLQHMTATSPENRRALFLLRRRRMRKRAEESVAVDLSPLIDAVFLLLIFFLVTTMLKRLEKQIPVVLPDSTAAPARIAKSEEIIFALDANGRIAEGSKRRGGRGEIRYERVDNFDGRLKEIAENRGLAVPVRVDAEREVPFQTVIDSLDTLSIQGFEKVGVRLYHREEEYFELSDLKGED